MQSQNGETARYARPPVASLPAPRSSDPALVRSYSGPVPVGDPTRIYQRSKAGPGFLTSRNYGLLREIEAKDGRVAGMIQQRKSALLRRRSYWKLRRNTPESRMCADFMRQVVCYINRYTGLTGGFAGDMRQMLDSPLEGIYTGKQEWRRLRLALDGGDSRPYSREFVIPVRVEQENLDRVGFDKDNRLMINARLTDEDAQKQGFKQVEGATDWWYPSPFSYFVFNPYAYADNPEGKSLLATILYAAWFKRQARLWHAQFIERNSSPVAVAESDANGAAYMTEEVDHALDEALEAIQQQTDLKMPPGWKFRWAELMSNASAQAFADFEQFCDREIASALLGQSSTSLEATGAVRTAEVQERVADTIVASDGLMLQGAINAWATMILAHNLPQYRDDWPEFVIQTVNDDVLAVKVKIYEGLAQLDVKIPMSAIYDEFLINPPAPGEAVLVLQTAPMAAPSQQTDAKTEQKQTERATNAAPTSQAQPARQAA